MTSARFKLLCMALFFSFSAFSISFITYQELSSDLINLHSHRNHESVVSKFKAPLLTHLDKLIKTDPSNQDFYVGLKRIVVYDDNAHITLNDLTLLLVAMQERYASGMHHDLERKLPDCLTRIVTGAIKIKNVLVVGRTRGGKSTFLAMLMDPLNKTLSDQISQTSLFSHTVHSKHYLAIFDSLDDGLYVARLIDTPGLSELKSRHSEVLARTDGEIIGDIANAVSGLTIDHVFQIFPLPSSGINSQDFSAFKVLQDSLLRKHVFPNDEGRIDLIFPRADQTTQEIRCNLVNQLASIFAQYGVHHYGTFLFSGILFNDYFAKGWADSLLITAPETLLLRNRILEHIFGTTFTEYMDIVNDNTENISPAVETLIRTIIPPMEEVDFFFFDEQV